MAGINQKRSITNVQEPRRTDAFRRKRPPDPIKVDCTMDGGGSDSSTLDTCLPLCVPPCRIKNFRLGNRHATRSAERGAPSTLKRHADNDKNLCIFDNGI